MIAGQPKNKRQLKKAAQMEAIATSKLNESMNGNGNANGTDNMDVDMNEDDEKHEHDDGDEDEEVNGDKNDGEEAWISCLAASDDGQWLVSSDTNARVTIYNLDTLQVSPLPTVLRPHLSTSDPQHFC